LHDYKQYYQNSTLNLYISYFVTPEFVVYKRDKSEKIILQNSNGQRKNIKRLPQTNFDFPLVDIHKEIKYSPGNFMRSYKIKHYLNVISKNSFSPMKAHTPLRTFNVLDFKTDGVLTQIFKVLNLFVGNSLNIHVNFCCINKSSHFLKSTKKKTFLSLQRFKNTPFFKEGIELLFHITYNSNSANLLAKFIAFQLKKVKRQKFLLSFLKQTLTLLLNSNLTKVSSCV